MEYEYTFRTEELNNCYNCRKDLEDEEIFLYKDKKYCVSCSPWNNISNSLFCFRRNSDKSQTLSNVSSMTNLSDYNIIDDDMSDLNKKLICSFNSFKSLSSFNSNPIIYSIHNTYIFLTCVYVYCNILKKKLWK